MKMNIERMSSMNLQKTKERKGLMMERRRRRVISLVIIAALNQVKFKPSWTTTRTNSPLFRGLISTLLLVITSCQTINLNYTNKDILKGHCQDLTE